MVVVASRKWFVVAVSLIMLFCVLVVAELAQTIFGSLHLSSMATSNVMKSILAGALTGVFETLLMYPLENLKTQQQLDSRPIKELFRRTVDTYGLGGLYRGMSPVLIGAIPTQAVRWGTYEFVCGLHPCKSIGDVFIAGLISGCFVAVATGIPVESLKTHMIHGLHSPSSPGMTPTTPLPVSPSSGFRPHSPQVAIGGVPFKGWAPTIFKKVVNQAVRFPAHSAVFRGLCALTVAEGVKCQGSTHPLFSFIAGASAGLSSILITQPIDVIKTRMQGFGAERYGHSWTCCYMLLKEEGPWVFFDGMVPRTVRVALGAGTTFTIFPLMKALFGGE